MTAALEIARWLHAVPFIAFTALWVLGTAAIVWIVGGLWLVESLGWLWPTIRLRSDGHKNGSEAG
ncbi:MAG: hypothetical protein K2V38_26515 [Gemmataceae bacterium]|nr:hypothetical protein [Gemmataceae bacterium]